MRTKSTRREGQKHRRAYSCGSEVIGVARSQKTASEAEHGTRKKEARKKKKNGFRCGCCTGGVCNVPPWGGARRYRKVIRSPNPEEEGAGSEHAPLGFRWRRGEARFLNRVK